VARVVRTASVGDWVALSCIFRDSSELLEENLRFERTSPNKRTIGRVGDLPCGDGSLERNGLQLNSSNQRLNAIKEIISEGFL
jgi:hypothetical protein